MPTHASIIAREAEARAGELLKEMDLGRSNRGDGRPGKTSSPKEADVSPLKGMGLSKKDSERFHAAASLTEEEREELYDEAKKKQRPVAATAPLKAIRQKRKQAKAEELKAQPLPAASASVLRSRRVPLRRWAAGGRGEDSEARGGRLKLAESGGYALVVAEGWAARCP